MIFVTVGTHEQPFNRLIEHMDKLKENGVIAEDVVIQTGFSTYEPRYCIWSKLFPYSVMKQNVSDARLVVTHGGPSSFIMPLQMGKIPIVVPRKKEFGEHINNHQIEFCKAVSDRMGTIIVVEDIEELGGIIKDFHNNVANMGRGISSNNAKFCDEFSKIVDKMFLR